MITVEVVRVNGSAPAVPLSAAFDDFGGTIGRGPDCTLILIDDKRSVSRVHARFACRDGTFHVTDEGTNPLKINGNPLGKGNEAPIADGDVITIGPYELSVKTVSADVVDEAFGSTEEGNPFADLLGTPAPSAAKSSSPFADLGFDQPAQPVGGGVFDDLGIGTPAPAPAPPRPSAPAAKSASPFDDLLGPSSSSGSPSSSPFDDLGFGSAPPAPDTSQRSGPMAALPADFDPMAPPPAAPAAGLGPSLPDDDFSSLGGGPRAPGEGSLDAMFGLSSTPERDPFAGGALAKPKNSGSSTDSGLTQWLGGIKAPAAEAVSDRVPELHSAFTPPRAITPEPTPPKSAPPRPAPPPPQAAPPPPRPAPPRPAPPPEAKRPAPEPRGARAATPAPAPPKPRAALPAGDLLGALLAGLDAPDLQLDDLSPELMHKIGVLLHEATRGTLALLVARGTLKRELKADVTMIASGRNNPLKFSPDTNVALRYLLGPPAQGFMEAEQAMKDAYGDLTAHEFGFMAGMRAALTGVLKRFAPETLEARLPAKGGIGGLLAANRKSQLWDLFNDHYRHITQDIEEDFHAVFGREFLRAYEEHVEAMEQQNRGRR